MKQGTVKFSKEFITPIGLKEWITIELPTDFDMQDVPKVYEIYDKIVEMTNNCHARSTLANIDLGWTVSNQPPSTIPQPLPVIDKAQERLEVLIDNATTRGELLGYKELVINNDRLFKLWSDKIAQLTTNTTTK